MQGESTNTEDVVRFLQIVREACIYPSDQRITIVLDNHKAHTTMRTTWKMRELNMHAMFMPSYSP
jgi:transposase